MQCELKAVLLLQTGTVSTAFTFCFCTPLILQLPVEEGRVLLFSVLNFLLGVGLYPSVGGSLKTNDL